MTIADKAAIASAVIAFLSMIGAGVGWFLARREKKAAAKHEEKALKAARDAADAAERSAAAATRSADAGERAAAAQEAMVSATAEDSAADLEAPWQFSRDGDTRWLLHNRLARRAYGIKLTGARYFHGDPNVDKIDGYSTHAFDVINGSGESVTVSWHWLKDLTDEVSPWTGRLP